MTAEEFTAMVNKLVTERDYVWTAIRLCDQMRDEIQKTGGEIQRSKGVKLLRRIDMRLHQRFYLGEYGGLDDQTR